MEKILCAARNTDFRGFAIAPDFQNLPDEIKEKLRVICVDVAENAGGIFIIQFEEDGSIQFVTENTVDDIAAGVRISRLQRDYEELWEQLKLFYRIFVLHEKVEDLL